MDIATAVKALNGKEYGEEGSREFFAMMKESGLVAVFGASDDLMELRGAIEDEVSAYDGGTVYLTECGLFQPCESDDCPHEKTVRANCRKIEALWCPDETTSWAYKTDIPHQTFEIMEGGEVYCRGIVFSLADAA